MGNLSLSNHRGDGIFTQIDGDTVVLSNANTTIGYARFSKRERHVEYVFVNPIFRRQGYGRHLIDLCESECGRRLTEAPPVSPLGQKFFSRIAGSHP